MIKPDIHKLLKQFNLIGGMAQTGQAGFCMLMALWQKSNELNWSRQFTMTNAELLYRAGFNNVQTLINVRNQLKQLEFIDYLAPKNRRNCGTYVMNFEFGIFDYSNDYSNGLNSDLNSSLNSDFNRPLNSDFNINKHNNTSSSASETRAEYITAAKHYEKNIGTVSGTVVMSIQEFYSAGVEEDLIIAAIDEACLNNKKSWSYIKAILDRCVSNNILTKDKYLAAQVEYKNTKEASKNKGANFANKNTKYTAKSGVRDFNNFKNREYDAKDLQEKLIKNPTVIPTDDDIEKAKEELRKMRALRMEE